MSSKEMGHLVSWFDRVNKVCGKCNYSTATCISIYKTSFSLIIDKKVKTLVFQ